MRRHLVPLSLLAAFALASCGQSTVDADRAQRFIRGVVVERVGARVATVTCPREAEKKKGGRFTCTVTGTDGSKGDVLVTQGEEDSDVFNVNPPFLHVREAEAVMEKQLGKRAKAADVSVACPQIVVTRKDALFRCKATSAGKARAVSARFTDEAGHFLYRMS
jgi:hypothetical protein